MKILIANAIYPTDAFPDSLGGAEKSVRKIAQGLADLGHEVHVVAPLGPSQDRVDEDFNGVHVHRLPTRNIYDFHQDKSPNPAKRLAWHLIDDLGIAPADFGKLIDTVQPDVLHTNTLSGLSSGLWKIASKRGVPVVHTLRDYYLMCTRCTLFRKEKICEKACADCSVVTQGRKARTRYVDGVVGNSKFTLDLHLDAGLFPNTVIQQPIGSITEAQSVATEIASPKRAADAPVVFGYIGRLSPTKGLDQVLEAVTQCTDNARLVIAGSVDTDLGQELVARFGDNDRVTFAGFVSPQELYDQVDVIVAPSLWYEPLPRSVVDALSFGKPVVGSNRGGTPEAMGTPPRGWVYDPAQPNDLRLALKHAIDWARSGTPFDPLPVKETSVLDAYLNVYQATIDAHKAAAP